MASPVLTRFFGGPPGWVLLRLVLLSVVIGLIFSAIGLHPLDLIDGLRRFIGRIWDMGWEALEWAATYFLLGAMVVFPVWLVLRLLKVIGPRR